MEGGGALAAGLSCGSCGARLGATAKFCSECGSPLTQPTQSAEYKQVTALLADARGDESVYRDYRDRYRATATALGFEGHMEWAEAMP